MAKTKLIQGEELQCRYDHQGKTFSIGSKLQWGNKVWDIVESTHICTACYFDRYGKCYRSGIWLDELGECAAFARADNLNVIFQLHKM